MKSDYEARHDLPDEPAESGTLDEEFVGKSRSTLRFSRYLLLCILVLVLAITLMTNSDSINLDNFRRMWHKLDFGPESAVSSPAFAADSMAVSYKDGVAILTPSVLRILDNAGREFMNVTTGFTSPALLTDNRYTVAYDRSGTKLIVTNSFSVVAEKNMPETISYVTVSEDHYLSVITSGNGYKNSLYVYNDDFEEIFVWHSNDRYLLNACVSPDEKTVSAVCYNIKDGADTPEFVGIHLDEEQISWSVTLEGLPLDMCYKSASNIALLHSDHVDFYSGNGKLSNTYVFEKNFLQAYVLDADRTLLVLSGSKRGESTLYSVSDRGKASVIAELTDTVQRIDENGGRAALLGEKSIQIVSLMSNRVLYERAGDSAIQDICFAGKNTLLDIYSTYCVYNELD
ncbi:MAG: hypothetical protein IKY33_03505 [Clostridia bacterium]|nr:hypothetical protein [Clostridia bacterium]